MFQWSCQMSSDVSFVATPDQPMATIAGMTARAVSSQRCRKLSRLKSSCELKSKTQTCKESVPSAPNQRASTNYHRSVHLPTSLFRTSSHGDRDLLNERKGSGKSKYTHKSSLVNCESSDNWCGFFFRQKSASNWSLGEPHLPNFWCLSCL